MDEHRTCGKIKPLDVAAKGVKNATMLEDVASQVEYLIDTASKVREQRQKSKVVSATIFELAVSTSSVSFFSISSMRFKIRDLNISTALFTLSVLKSHVTLLFCFCDISQKFDFVTKHGSEKQIFRLIKTLETGLSRKSEDLEKLISSLNVPQLLFLHSKGIFESNSNLF
jgi:hypothetical protein